MSESFCSLCKGEGRYLQANSEVFCPCPIGMRKKDERIEVLRRVELDRGPRRRKTKEKHFVSKPDDQDNIPF